MNNAVKVKHDLRILAIDDSSEARAILKHLLRKVGFTNIVDASDGIQALKILNDAHGESEIELILADWNMPLLNGFDLLRKIRADVRFESIPFIMVTALNEKDQVLLALKTGASNYLLKPISSDSLIKKIADTLKRA